ncbi:pyridoxamine 5'-phosphate oxidase family protein [Azospirillum halopraeferens]|uniref:pyridoxamine 5'-phosphate oxidase family protein n=1 Tax=Azospirillum halopraeferens TaxID=34010 RepID=UPI000426B9E4|nr:pyridoxamine 5'-phosphate oxidase family protein [Azospirillum halopraeferens]
MARRILRATDRATLATLSCDDGGWPYPSLVLVALDHDATPLLLLSTLALHTANIAADGRVGLLFDATAGLARPLAGGRVSVLGRAERSDEPRHRARFRARHPGAAFTMEFADFAIYRVAVERAHFVAGFGRVHRIDAADLLLDRVPPALAAAEGELLIRLNETGVADAAGYPRGEGWTLTGIDPEGADLRRDGAVARWDFDGRAEDAEGAEAAIADLVRRTRREGAGTPPSHGRRPDDAGGP